VNDLGFEGIRFDYSRGYGGKYAALYAKAALSDDQFAVGEYWIPLDYDEEGNMLPDQEKHRKKVVQWLEEAEDRCLAFDFGTKGLLQDAIRFKKYDWMVDSEGRPHGLIGVQPELSVTFIDNHVRRRCHPARVRGDVS
jgi:alpha-amylase